MGVLNKKGCKNKMETSAHNIAICVFACATIPRYLEQIRTVRNTWFRDAIDAGVRVYFILGGGDGDEPVVPHECMTDEFVYLPGVKNDYESASHKQNLGIKYIFSSQTPPEFVFCCGTDTYVSIENLISILRNFSPEQMIYLGGHGCYRLIDGKNIYFHSGGPGFILSRALVEYIENKIVPFDKMFEEWRVVCERNGEKTLHELLCACDVAIAYFVHMAAATAAITPLVLLYDDGFCFLDDIKDDEKRKKVIGCPDAISVLWRAAPPSVHA